MHSEEERLEAMMDDMEPESAMTRLTDLSFPSLVCLAGLFPLWAPCVLLAYSAGYVARWVSDAWKAGWSL